MANKNYHISITRVSLATKLGRMITFLDGLLPIMSHDSLITWPCEIRGSLKGGASTHKRLSRHRIHWKNSTRLGFRWLAKSVETIKFYKRSFSRCYSLCFCISMVKWICNCYKFRPGTPANIFLFKVKCEMCSNLKLWWRRCGAFIVNFKHISHLFLPFLLLTLDR